MKVFTTRGRKVLRQPSKYERFIEIHIQLGMTAKDARYEWRFFMARMNYKMQMFENDASRNQSVGSYA